MALDPQRLERRKHGRAQAVAIMELIDLPHEECIDAFLDELQKRLLPAAAAIAQKTTQHTIRELAATEIGFGKYIGRTYGQVDDGDRSYLEWLLESSQETADTLSAYLELTADDGNEE